MATCPCSHEAVTADRPQHAKRTNHHNVLIYRIRAHVDPP